MRRRQRERTNRLTDPPTDTATDRQTERQIDRQKDRHTDRHIYIRSVSFNVYVFIPNTIYGGHYDVVKNLSKHVYINDDYSIPGKRVSWLGSLFSSQASIPLLECHHKTKPKKDDVHVDYTHTPYSE